MPERRQWRRSNVFIVNFEHISNVSLVFLLFGWVLICLKIMKETFNKEPHLLCNT